MTQSAVQTRLHDRSTEQFLAEGHTLEDEWATLIFVQVFPYGTLRDKEPESDGEKRVRKHLPVRYLFVQDFGKRPPYFYKMAGGKKQPGETPTETARRELRGETGLDLDPRVHPYEYQGTVDKGNHLSILFRIQIEEDVANDMHDRDSENEGEKPHLVSREEFEELVRSGEFFPPHLRRLENRALVLCMPAPPSR